MNRILDDFRGRQFLGTADLADEATSIIKQVGATQERGTVKDHPDERTVRYYLSEGLIPPPDDKSGIKSVFGFRHLLTILVIKQLQSQHLPIRKIREIIEGKSERDLERMLGPEFGTGGTKNDARMFLEGLLMKSEPPRLMMSVDLDESSSRKSPASSAPSPVRTGSGSDQVRTGSGSDRVNVWSDDDQVRTGSGSDRVNVRSDDDQVRTGSGSDRQIGPPHSARPSMRWERFELFPGLEINIAANFRLPPDRTILEGVVDEFRRLLLGNR